MANKIQAVRGMNDILPDQAEYWIYLEEVLAQIAGGYGYRQIRLPIVEKTQLFKRSIGEVTDIIEKEMYTFDDRNGESLSLRPEGTASCVRAGIEHGLFYNQQPRLWYLGPAFRYEKPQQGRFRQFFQFGVEAFGIANPEIDAEQLLMTMRIWERLGLKNEVTLQINSLGSAASREKFREKLVSYFYENLNDLDEDSKRRLTLNPLRILDSKNPHMQLMLAAAPRILDCLDENTQNHFDQLRRYLDQHHIAYEINPRLVRGLDYYNMTVYEWVTERLGAQGTICAGGRYDSLVAHLGGAATPAVGFAMGLERVVMLLETVYAPAADPHVYIIMVGSEAISKGMQISEQLHKCFPELKIINDYSQGNFKNQFRRADKSGAKLALIIGDNELQTSTVAIKHLREQRPQVSITAQELENYLLRALVE